MIAQFALRLICGMSLMWALMPRRQVTSGFFRIQMLVVMGLGVLATLATMLEVQSLHTFLRQSNSLSGPIPWFASPMVVASPELVLAVLGFLGSVLWTLERRIAGEQIGFIVLVISVPALVGNGLRIGMVTLLADKSAMPETISVINEAFPLTRGWNSEHIWLAMFSQLTSSGVLGGVVVGMLLGHWYLTTPAMSIEPLKRINLFVGIGGVLLLLVSARTLSLLWSGAFDVANTAYMADTASRLSEVPTTWLGLRWLAGIIGPLVVSLMVWRILKYRNTQAATGVLFVGVILVFIGDMTAALLLRETGLPL